MRLVRFAPAVGKIDNDNGFGHCYSRQKRRPAPSPPQRR
jgi:hypothetical protein